MSPSCLNMSIAHSLQDKVKTPCGWKALLWFDPGRPPALVILSAPSPHHAQWQPYQMFCSEILHALTWLRPEHDILSTWSLLPSLLRLTRPYAYLKSQPNVTSDSCSWNTQSKLDSLMDFLIIPHVFLNSSITHMCLCVNSIKNSFPQ